MSQKNYKTFISRRQLYRRVAKNKRELLSHTTDNNVTITLQLENQLDNTDQDDQNILTENFSSIDAIPNSSFNLNADASNELTSNSIIMLNHESEYDPSSNIVENVCNEVTQPLPILNRIQQWANTSSAPRSDITRLLHILVDYHPELPLDARTLLGTSKKMTSKKLDTGTYCHFGILNFLKKFFYQFPNLLDTNENLLLSFNVDGIPLFTSSNAQLWPILGHIKNFKSRPFVVGIFCGKSKPIPLNNFLEDFICEFNSLCDGFVLYGRQCKLVIVSFICDAPARAYLKQIKGHGGYSACEKCTVSGTYCNGRVVLNSLNSPERTDESFARHIDEDHHIGNSPLINLPLGMVTSFAIDYMHCICLGVMRKLLNTWARGPLNVRFSGFVINSISNYLQSLKPHIPVEFNRKPRSILELNRWKATEFRMFLLYVGPIVLKNKCDVAIYENFLLFHTATTILACEGHIRKFTAEFGGALLKNFVKHSETLYGLQFIIYNVHLLLHIHNDVKKFGILDHFSAFPFESLLGKLKGLIKSTKHPLKEIHNRLIEMDLLASHCYISNYSAFTFKVEHNTGPLIPELDINFVRQYKKVYMQHLMLTSVSYSIANCYCSVENCIIQIHNILKHNNNSISIIGKKFLTKRSLYKYPIDSQLLKVFVVGNLDNVLNIWSNTDSIIKCFMLPYNTDNNEWVSMPIIHSME
uniref:DUF4218 domain-containing protein n=1 Tax=Photinus pyralis TaxID=7054 RepID=A0A1Y1L231_PHOPY